MYMPGSSKAQWQTTPQCFAPRMEWAHGPPACPGYTCEVGTHVPVRSQCAQWSKPLAGSVGQAMPMSLHRHTGQHAISSCWTQAACQSCCWHCIQALHSGAVVSRGWASQTPCRPAVPSHVQHVLAEQATHSVSTSEAVMSATRAQRSHAST